MRNTMIAAARLSPGKTGYEIVTTRDLGPNGRAEAGIFSCLSSLSSLETKPKPRRSRAGFMGQPGRF